MSSSFFNKIMRHPIVAAVKNVSNLEIALKSNCELIFLLTGSIFNLKELIEKILCSGKGAFVHIDLLEGFSRDYTSLKYIHEHIEPNGIITTRPSLAKKAADMGLFTIQRVFIFDSLSRETAIESLKGTKINAVEILPGIMPRTIKRITEETKKPLIAGGLFEEKNDVIRALKAGAIGISTSNQLLWNL